MAEAAAQSKPFSDHFLFTYALLNTANVLDNANYRNMPGKGFSGVLFHNNVPITFTYKVGPALPNGDPRGVIIINKAVAGLLFARSRENFNRWAEYKVADFGDIRLRFIPSMDTINDFSVAWRLNESIIHNCSDIPLATIIPFMMLDTFHKRYQIYVCNPDKRVKILDCDAKGNDEGLSFLIECWDAMGFNVVYGDRRLIQSGGGLAQRRLATKTDGQVIFLCHIIAIVMFKKFAPDSPHLNNFVAKSIGALKTSNAMKYEIEGIQWQNFITADCLRSIGIHYVMFPKLRSCILQSIIETNDARFAYTKQLISYVSMTSVYLIENFLNATQKTAAHTHPLILKECVSFGLKYFQLAAKHGLNIRYMGVLDPNFSDLDIDFWPNLEYVAAIYASHYQGVDKGQYITSKEVIVLQSVSRIVATQIPDDCYNEKLGNLVTLMQPLISKLQETLHLDTDFINSQRQDNLNNVLNLAPDPTIMAQFRMYGAILRSFGEPADFPPLQMSQEPGHASTKAAQGQQNRN